MPSPYLLTLFLLLLPLAQTVRVPLLYSIRQAPPSTRVPPQFNINSGGRAVGRFIREKPAWLVGNTTAFAQPTIVIGGAEDKNLPMYKSLRYGNGGSAWGYDIPVMEPGLYDCTVHFAETFSDSFSDGARVFDLFMATTSGEPVTFDDIDIHRELNGAEFTVLTKTAQNLVIPGILSIRVNPSVGEAIMQGITCERTADLPDGVVPDWKTDPTIPTEVVDNTATGPGSTVPSTEININAGGPAIGRFSAEDFSWIRGETSTFAGPDGSDIGGSEERNRKAVKSHRYGLNGGKWGYVIPIASVGLYHCSLHFAETDTESFRVGARVFKIMIQDRMMDDVDIYRDSNRAPFTAVVKTFLDLKVGNELFIVLMPKVGNAFLSAITCERIGDLDPSDIEALNSPTPSPDFEEMPTPALEATTNGNPTPSPEDIPSITVGPIESNTPRASPTPIIIGPNAATVSPIIIPIPNPPSASPSPSRSTKPLRSSMPTLSTIPVSKESVTPKAMPTQTPGVAASISPVSDSPFPTPVPAVSNTPGLVASSSPSPSSIGALMASPLVTPDFMASGEPSPDPTFVDIPLDAVLSVGDDESEARYELTGLVSGDGVFTVDMKSTLMQVSEEASGVSTKWAMVGITRDVDEVGVSRQAAEDSESYSVDMQAVYKDSDVEEGFEDYESFVKNGEVNTKLQENSIENLDITFRTEPNLQMLGTKASTDDWVLIGSLVGGGLVALTVVALAVFVFVRRNRNHSASAAAFDAPPPALSESDGSTAERSETAVSVEYLDDDSTFTAATSRAGDPVDQVGYDKDVFGRGTTSGAHGSAGSA